MPITLEQLAREQGVLLSDRRTPCKSNLPKPLPPASSSIPFNASSFAASRGHHGQCVIYFLGAEVNTAAFALYVFSFSVFVQALLIISMSGAADHGRFRKTLLLSFAFIGSIASMLFLPITSKVYYLGAVLAIVANTCIGASFVLLNSFLPLLVRHHPELRATRSKPAGMDGVVEREADEEGENGEINSTTALLRPKISGAKQKKTTSPALQLSTRISSNGIGIGYVAAVIVQIISAFIVYALRGSTFSLRLVLFCIGLWWFIFSIPAVLWLRPRPGPPVKRQSKYPALTYIIYGWVALGKTLTRARRLRDLLTFLVAWFFLSDAIATVSGTAILFAKTSLGMAPASLALINVVVMLSGVAGALLWNRVSRFFNLKPTQTIIACVFLFELIPAYALLGYIPAVRRLGVIGLQQPWEMYPLGFVYGIVIAGVSSYCRALFGELVPPGFEASYFALYAITDKGSSIFGPAIVGAITNATGNIRPVSAHMHYLLFLLMFSKAFWFLAVLIGLPIPLLYLVDVERGKLDAAAMVKELEGEDAARIAASEEAEG